MVDTPVPISEIDDPDSIRVVLWQSNRFVHAPLVAVSPLQGDFTGPASSTADNIVTFADTTGKLGKDSGIAVGSLAPKASPALTGTPTSPTAAPGTNTTQVATTAFVTAAIAALSTVYQAASAALTALAGIGTAVAGDIIYATGAGAWGRLAKGTGLQILRMNTGATAPEWATAPFSASFTSSGQTVSSAGSLTLAHGLGAEPKLVMLILECATADAGYSIGDRIVYSAGITDTSNNFGIAIWLDATNVNVRFGSAAQPIRTIDKTTGDRVSLVNASWSLFVRAWA